MSDLEDKVVKNLKEFCRFLPGHVEFWKSVMKECKNRAIGLSNLSEQLRSVEKSVFCGDYYYLFIFQFDS